jgi:hypothetical protein
MLSISYLAYRATASLVSKFRICRSYNWIIRQIFVFGQARGWISNLCNTSIISNLNPSNFFMFAAMVLTSFQLQRNYIAIFNYRRKFFRFLPSGDTQSQAKIFPPSPEEFSKMNQLYKEEFTGIELNFKRYTLEPHMQNFLARRLFWSLFCESTPPEFRPAALTSS